MITPRTATDLALFGGKLAVDIPPPHFRWPVITQEEEEAVLTQLRSGPLSFGRRSGVIEQFESEFADFHKMPYAISTHCGTGALHAAFFGLGLKHGDEVLAPAYAHIATVQPMVHVGLIPVLCDVDENTGNIDPADAERRISSRTRAIVVIHQYGHVADMDAIHAMSRRHGLRIIEDASHAHGATYNGALAGTLRRRSLQPPITQSDHRR